VGRDVARNCPGGSSDPRSLHRMPAGGRRPSQIYDFKRETGWRDRAPSVGSSCLSSVQRMSADSEVRHHSCRGSVHAPPGGPPGIDGNSVVGIAYGAKRPSSDLADGIIAKQIVELAKTGERNPDLLCEAALKKLHGICIATSTLRAERRASPLGLASLLLSLAVCRSRMNCGTHLKGSHSLSLLFRL